MSLGMDTYMQTAVCLEQTEVLVLERKQYVRLFVRRHPGTVESMRQRVAVKMMLRRSLHLAGDIALFDHVIKVSFCIMPNSALLSRCYVHEYKWFWILSIFIVNKPMPKR